MKIDRPFCACLVPLDRMAPIRTRAIDVTIAVLLYFATLTVATIAGPLDPNAFTSLGTLNVTSGTLNINTDTLAISGAASFMGVVMPQSGGPEIAVFTFDGIDVSADATIAVSGTRPLALLSHSDIAIDTAINLNGGAGTLATGGSGAAGGVGGPAGGHAGGSGGVGGSCNPFSCPQDGAPGDGSGGGDGGGRSRTNGLTGGGGGGAGFGGDGAVGAKSGALQEAPGGNSYGDLLVRLEGGSGGGGAGGKLGPTVFGGHGGGGGAGAIEIGAVGSVSLATITADGGSAYSAARPNGGGGSGGGVLAHGAMVNIVDGLTALGGLANSDSLNAGAGGAGGRVAVLGWASSYAIGNPVAETSIAVNGGSAFRDGRAGVITLGPNSTIIPTGRSLVLDGAPVVVSPGSMSNNDPTIAVLVQRDLTVQSGGQATLGASEILLDSAHLTVEGMGIFDVMPFSQTVATLSGDGEVRIGSGGSLRVGSGDATSTFPGRISGAGNLRKTGTGMLTLIGANTYGGTTYVEQGTLVLSNALSTPGSPIDIAMGGTLQASGIVQRSPIGTGAIAAAGALLIGDLSSTSGFEFDGSLDVGSHTVQLLDADAAHLGGQTTLAAAGRLVSINGIVLDPARSLTASASAQVDGNFANNGTVNGPTAAGQFLTFTDDVDGAGSYTGNILFSDGFSPGTSPALVSFENLAFDSTATLLIELGGAMPGSEHDQMTASGIASLAGTLDVVLVDEFMPGDGDAFEIVIAAGSVTGTFVNELLPALPGELLWEVVYGANSVTLEVTAPGLAGDFNADGSVDAADYVVWRKNDGSQGGYNTWRANYGRDSAVGGNAASPRSIVTAVPEPANLLLCIIGMVGATLFGIMSARRCHVGRHCRQQIT